VLVLFISQTGSGLEPVFGEMGTDREFVAELRDMAQQNSRNMAVRGYPFELYRRAHPALSDEVSVALIFIQLACGGFAELLSVIATFMSAQLGLARTTRAKVKLSAACAAVCGGVLYAAAPVLFADTSAFVPMVLRPLGVGVGVYLLWRLVRERNWLGGLVCDCAWAARVCCFGEPAEVE
jgi:hypothetical protein